MGDIRNIVNKKEDLKGKSEQSCCVWNCFCPRLYLRLFSNQMYLVSLPSLHLVIPSISSQNLNCKVYVVIENSLAPQGQLHPNQNLRLKRRGENRCNSCRQQFSYSRHCWPNDSFCYLVKMLPCKVLTKVRKLFHSFIYSSRYTVQHAKTFL